MIKNTEQFIQKSKEVYGDKYEYTNSIYVNAKTKIKITCKEHGIFEQNYKNHLNGFQGCVFCRKTKNGTDYKSFIEKSNVAHNNKYTYLEIPAFDINNKITIVCPVHGDFVQTAYKHSRGYGCLKCSKEESKYSTEQFIQICNNKHNFKYDYSSVNYVDSKTKVQILCPEHGIFFMTAQKHVAGQKCKGCVNRAPVGIDKFIKKSNEVHSFKYDYSLVNYQKIIDKVKIICPAHGIFEQRANQHMLGRGCKICANNVPYTTERFILSARTIHGDKYDYSLVYLKKLADKIKIICPIHGIINQTADGHLSGRGCISCCKITKNSHGAMKIENYLKENHIIFEKEFKFADCKNKRKLPFDFLIRINAGVAIIEYNGSQHFKQNNWNRLEYIQQNDKIKRDYCKERNIPLLDINYNEHRKMKQNLDDFINKLKENIC